jgi:hypothetical protein
MHTNTSPRTPHTHIHTHIHTHRHTQTHTDTHTQRDTVRPPLHHRGTHEHRSAACSATINAGANTHRATQRRAPRSATRYHARRGLHAGAAAPRNSPQTTRLRGIHRDAAATKSFGNDIQCKRGAASRERKRSGRHCPVGAAPPNCTKNYGIHAVPACPRTRRHAPEGIPHKTSTQPHCTTRGSQNDGAGRQLGVSAGVAERLPSGHPQQGTSHRARTVALQDAVRHVFARRMVEVVKAWRHPARHNTQVLTPPRTRDCPSRA